MIIENFQLLLFLVGSLLYGFLARELYRRPSVMGGNLAMRVHVTCLAIWYCGRLLDEVVESLIGRPNAAFLSALDVVTWLALLFACPLLAHAVWFLVRGGEGAAPGPRWLWLLPSHLFVLVFLPGVWEHWTVRGESLTALALNSQWAMLVHVLLAMGLTSWFAVLALKKGLVDRSLQHFLRWLLVAAAAASVLLLVATASSGMAAPSTSFTSYSPDFGVMLWSTLCNAAGLIPGATFLYFVQRYNLLQLSLSHRSVRHFLTITLLVVLVMALGPVVGQEGEDAYQRLIAGGVLLALLAGVSYPLVEVAARRSTGLSRLLGLSTSPKRIEALSRRIQSLELEPEEMRRATALEVGKWLGAPAEFLVRPGPDSDEPGSRLWRHFESADARAFNRVDVPGAELAHEMTRLDLHAVFPLRSQGELVGLLGLAVSASGGGYDGGEIEAVQLLLRQLGASLAVRNLADERVERERELGERERLGMLGLVAASLAHEMKNPLAAMKALSQTVQQELRTQGGQPQHVKDLGVIVEQIDRLDGVAREVLGFAKPSEQGEVDLSELVRSAVYVLGQESKRRGVVINDEGVTDVGVVPGSPGTWQTIVFNLMLNAAHHAPAGSEAFVRLSRQDRDVMFEVQNGGDPIPADVEEKLFTPFNTDGGTGLGLALVARRVTALGGEIQVSNQSDRILFTVRVPADRRAADSQPKPTLLEVPDAEADVPPEDAENWLDDGEISA